MTRMARPSGRVRLMEKAPRPSRKSAAAAAALFAAALSAAAFCGCRRGSPPAAFPVRGVLLVTLSEGSGVPGDLDELGLSPFRVSPVSAELLPSAASAVTGLLPPEHGLRTDGVGALPASVPTLGAKFAARGFDCAAFLSDAALAPVHGLSAGFSEYSARPSTNAATRFRVPSGELCAAAAAWISSRPDRFRPVFLWLHLSPLAGAAPTWASAPAHRAGLGPGSGFDGLSGLVAAFDAGSPVVVVPLFESAPESTGARSPDVPGEGGVPVSATGYGRNVRDCPGGASVADVPWLLGMADEMRPSYWESLVPWYAFRLPPLAVAGPGAPDPAKGLSGPVAPAPLARQSEMALLRAAGHLGEGLVPPLPGSVAVEPALSPESAGRIARWRAALASTNRLEAARALVESDPEVPLFLELLGSELAAAGDSAGACNAYSRVSDLGYNMVRANRTLSRLHAALGNVAASIDRAEAAFLAGEEDPVTRRELAQLLLRAGVAMGAAGENRAAGDCIDRVLLLEPSNPVARLESARLRLRVGDTNAASSILRSALRDAPKFAPAAKLLQEIERR